MDIRASLQSQYHAALDMFRQEIDTFNSIAVNAASGDMPKVSLTTGSAYEGESFVIK
jgi:hypothetical protein